MSTTTTQDDIEILARSNDGKNGEPVVVDHSSPNGSENWDAQLLFFLLHG